MDSTTIIGIVAGALVVLVVLFLAARSRGAKTAGPAKNESPHPSAPFPIPDAPPPSSRLSSKPPPKKVDTPPPSSAPASSEPEPAKAEPTSAPIDLRSKSEPPGPLDRPPTQPPPVKPPSEPPVSADREPISVEPISVKPAVSDAPPALDEEFEEEEDAKTQLRQSPMEMPAAAPVAHTAETVKPPPPPVPARPSDRMPVSPRVPPPAPKPAPPAPPVAAKKEEDFSSLNEPAPVKPTEKQSAVTKPAYVPPSNPATADLEKNDPRHASARRFARVAVSEIKLYHEAEVKAGREAKDLWTRLSADIGLAKQTYEARVDKEVRERFDYLYDEILRQLADGDVAKLGPEAPKKTAPVAAPVDDAKVTAPAVTKRAAEPAPAPSPAPIPDEPPTKKHEVVAEVRTDAKATVPGVSAQRYAPPSNPETAELEKNDSRHSAARRFARVAVSEIKLYHEAEVKAGREAKDLWTRLSADINLAKQSYEARVDKEVRDRFDYLYDEILRQLAEGDIEKLGPEAPKKGAAPAAAPAPSPEPSPEPKKISERKVPAAAPAAPAAEKKVSERNVPAAAPAPAPPKSEPKVAAPAPAGDTKATQPSAISKYLPPSNPATAELEKSDPRHAAARRLARLSVSEIKLYHEEEVKAGREAKDLWKRLSVDIGLAMQTYEKRVDKEVRERFDYLYDEILRQLAEGDADKLGPEAPKGKNV